MGNQKCGGGLGPLGRLALVQVLLWFCKQSVRTQLGRTGRLCWGAGHGPEVAQNSSLSGLRGFSLPLSPHPETLHSPVTSPSFPEATSPGGGS